mmetsp:Transcript_23952/g.41742  ORF Transcript_23952/g.41742 Transcript_23952/m.41742 type:complete len:382 (-) Transcript_23952:73-1218(-)
MKALCTVMSARCARCCPRDTGKPPGPSARPPPPPPWVTKRPGGRPAARGDPGAEGVAAPRRNSGRPASYCSRSALAFWHSASLVSQALLDTRRRTSKSCSRAVHASRSWANPAFRAANSLVCLSTKSRLVSRSSVRSSMSVSSTSRLAAARCVASRSAKRPLSQAKCRRRRAACSSSAASKPSCTRSATSRWAAASARRSAAPRRPTAARRSPACARHRSASPPAARVLSGRWCSRWSWLTKSSMNFFCLASRLRMNSSLSSWCFSSASKFIASIDSTNSLVALSIRDSYSSVMYSNPPTSANSAATTASSAVNLVGTTGSSAVFLRSLSCSSSSYSSSEPLDPLLRKFCLDVDWTAGLSSSKQSTRSSSPSSALLAFTTI